MAKFRLPASAWVIIIGLGVVSTGTYMIIPFFALYLTEELGMTAAQIGFALAVRTLIHNGFTLVGGMASDRWGARRIMILGLLVRTAAFVELAVARTLTEVVIGSALFGLASALYIPSGKAAVVRLAPPEHRRLVLSLRNTVGNVGVALGPLIGTAVVSFAPQMGFYGAALTGLIILVATYFWVPEGTGKRRFQRKLPTKELFALFRNPRAWILATFAVGFWTAYNQFELTMPIHVGRLMGEAGPTLLFTTNALVVILLQVPLTAWVARRWTAAATVAWGTVATGLGLGLMAMSHETSGLLAAAFIFTIGEILVTPVLDEMSVELAPKVAGTALGFMGLTAAAGGVLGTWAGGRVYDLLYTRGLENLFWYGTYLFCAILGLGALIWLGRLHAAPRRRRRNQVLVAHWSAVALPGQSAALAALFREYHRQLLPALAGKHLPAHLYRGTGDTNHLVRMEVELPNRRLLSRLLEPADEMNDWFRRLEEVAELNSLRVEVYHRVE